MNLQPVSRAAGAFFLLVRTLLPAPLLAAQQGPPPCSADVWPVLSLSGSGAARLRLGELTGEVPPGSRAFQTARTLVSSRCADSAGVLTVLPARLRSVAHSGWAQDSNDGLLWGGRGFNGLASAGVAARWGRLGAALAPQAAWHQNRQFEIQPGPPAAPFRNRWHPIDWPQRFGLDAFGVVHPGESHLRFDAEWVELSVSSENLWWGPASRYPLLLSNTGPGFPRFEISTPRPRSIGIGELEAQLFWGRLTESDYYDLLPENDREVLSAFTLAYRPSFFDGLWLGIGSLLHQHPADPFTAEDLGNIFDVITLRGNDNVPGNALVAVFFRWLLPESAFEVYGEYGRNDYALDTEDFLGEPDHSRAYNLGLRKAVPFRAGWLQVAAEVVHLQASVATWFRKTSSWYEGGAHGHSHQGQLLGAWVGPGSDAQFLSVDWFRGEKSTGVFLERIRWDDDAYQQRLSHLYGFHGHDVELALGVGHRQRLGAFVLDGELSGAMRRNRSFLLLDGVNWKMPWEENLRLDVSLIWVPENPEG